MSYYNLLNSDQPMETKNSYRVKGAVGVLSLLFSVGLLYKNEILYDNVSHMIVELGHNNLLDSANEGKLIYLKGRIQVNEPLTEPEYGVTIAAVKLKRRVQMYQWVEVQEESSSWWGTDETAPVTYTTTWRDRLVDNTHFIKPFGHANPKSFPVDSGVSVSEVVRLGGYTLGRDLKDRFNSFTLLTSDQRPDRRDIKMHSGLYYHAFDVWNPEVGDTRVQLSYAGASDDMVTILARQEGTLLQPYYTDTKDLTAVLEGEHPLSEILASKFPSSDVWLIRVPAYFAVFCAYSSLTFIIHSESVVDGLEGREHMLSKFLNLSKAFDCVHHETLLHQLETCGVRGLPHKWLSSYLRDRDQCMQIENTLSDKIKMAYGGGRRKRNRLLQALVSNNKSLLCHLLSAVTVFLVMATTWFTYSPLLGSLHFSAALILSLFCVCKGYSLYYHFTR